MTKLPTMLEQGYPVHRAHEYGDVHDPVIKGRSIEPGRPQAHSGTTDDVLNELFHAEVYNG